MVITGMTNKAIGRVGTYGMGPQRIVTNSKPMSVFTFVRMVASLSTAGP